jgi:hypothetical protein
MDNLFRRDLEELAVTLQWRQQSSGCLLTDVGNLLVRVTALTAQLSDRLVTSDLVKHRNTKAAITEVQRQTDGSELGFIGDYLHEKLQLLKYHTAKPIAH